MAHAGARAHALDFAGADNSGVADVVVLFQCASDDVSDNFHFAMAVRGKTARGADDVVVEDAQRAETHVGRIMVMVERKMPMGVKPIGFKVIALIRSNRLDHSQDSRRTRAGPPITPLIVP